MIVDTQAAPDTPTNQSVIDRKWMDMMSNNCNFRLLLASFIAPLAPCLILAFNPVVLIFAVPISYAAMFGFGLPLFVLFRKYWKINFLTCALGSLLAGFLAFVLFILVLNSEELFELRNYLGAPIFMAFGFISGVVFWALGTRVLKN